LVIRVIERRWRDCSNIIFLLKINKLSVRNHLKSTLICAELVPGEMASKRSVHEYLRIYRQHLFLSYLGNRYYFDKEQK